MSTVWLLTCNNQCVLCSHEARHLPVCTVVDSEVLKVYYTLPRKEVEPVPLVYGQAL